MNKQMIKYILSVILRTEAALMLLPAIVAVIYKESSVWSFVIAAVITVVASFVLARKKPDNDVIFAREGFLVVALAWIVLSVFGAIPFVVSGAIPDPIDALFETVSGFSTTGSTVLSDVECLPKGILFWREFTHWIGGMGVLVFVLAIVSLSDGRSMYLMRAEMPGPSVGKLTPKSRSTSLILYGIYTALTVALMIFLFAGGMPLYDSIIHAVGTAGTGGFSIKNASIGAYDSAYIDWVITIFMLLFGINFNLYYLFIIKRFKQALKSEELYIFLGLFAVVTLVSSINILPIYENFGEALRRSAFHVASLMSTTGFSTTDYGQWPNFTKALLIFVMMIGGCAGSTSGGLKTSRIVIMVKSLFRSMDQMVHPHKIKVVHFEGRPVDSDLRHSITTYLTTYMGLLVISTLVLTAGNFDFETSLTTAISCLGNVGPYFGTIGPMGNCSVFNGFEKLFLSLCMLVGRLEIFPMILLFSPAVWRKNS